MYSDYYLEPHSLGDYSPLEQDFIHAKSLIREVMDELYGDKPLNLNELEACFDELNLVFGLNLRLDRICVSRTRKLLPALLVDKKVFKQKCVQL